MASQGPSTKEIMLEAARQALGDEALETVQPTSVVPPPAASTPSGRVFDKPPVCRTQKPVPRVLRHGPASIMVGFNAECPRWVPGSVVRWAAWRSGFDSQGDADWAAQHMLKATKQWNAAKIGVTFEWVALAKDATFVLCHGGTVEGTLAESFFPNADDLSYVYVYTLAFDKKWKDHMWNIFMHELGHVLGLRHEFAMSPDPDWHEGGAEQLGPRDDMSVMNYRPEPPELQKNDVVSTAKFYALKKDKNGKQPKVGNTVVKDYTPM